jgi:hypothetical protein
MSAPNSAIGGIATKTPAPSAPHESRDGHTQHDRHDASENAAPGNARVDLVRVRQAPLSPSRSRAPRLEDQLRGGAVRSGSRRRRRRRSGATFGVRALVLMGLAATPFGLLERWVVSLWMMLAIVSTVGVKASCDHPHNRRYPTRRAAIVGRAYRKVSEAYQPGTRYYSHTADHPLDVGRRKLVGVTGSRHERRSGRPSGRPRR